MAKQRILARREFLGLAAAAGGAVALASCATAPPPAPTAAPVPTKAPAPAAAPTVAPTAAPARAPEPTKPPAAATAAPTAAQAAAPTAAPAATKAAAPELKIGRHLIGNLEGPEIVTDPAKYPKKFTEPPQLADLVKAGKLPPVQERVGQDPLVIKPVQEIGKHGGTWRRGFTGRADSYNGVRSAGLDPLLQYDYTGKKVMPGVAKSWELASDGKSMIINLRRGMRWSDGQPFTANDFVFWFEDMINNKELVPAPVYEMTINSKPITMQKVDDFTIKYTFPDPYFYFPLMVIGKAPGRGQALFGDQCQGGYAPAHYLKQFHAKYAAKDDLDKKVKDAKMDNWVNLFKFKTSWDLNPELPVVSPWKTVTPSNTPTWTLERNPYSMWVDTEGNQLPYIDKVTLTLAENLEVLNLRAIAGEYDFQERHMDLQKLPVLLENQSKGGYKIHLDTANFGNDAGLNFNMSYEADPEVSKWFDNLDFRRAFSLGIDRDQLNETFWLGLGVPSSPVPADDNPYNPGPEYRAMWHTFEPKKANEMLDKIGLDKKDGDGYRLRSDGKGRLRLEVMSMAGQFMPYTQICEATGAQLKKIGIQLDVREVERSLGNTRILNNDFQIFIWATDTTVEEMFFSQTVVPVSVSGWTYNGPLYGKYFATSGKEGKEPPPRLRAAQDMWRKAVGVPEAERLKLGKEIWKAVVEEVWQVGIAGLSPALAGTRVAKVNMGNVPARQANNTSVRTPASSLPPTFFWKK